MKKPLMLALTIVAVLTLFFTANNSINARDSKGTEFWIAFPGNDTIPAVSLYNQRLLITSDVNTSGTVSIPGMGYTTSFSVTANSVTTVIFPMIVDVQSSDVVTNRGIHVTSLDDITVYGVNSTDKSTDGFLSLPVDILGMEYQVLTYPNFGDINGNQFLIVGAEDGTTVTIVPSVTVGIHTAGVPYNITLDEGETYLLRDTNSFASDLSGSKITSDKPVGVFSSHVSANIPRGFVDKDYLVEMMPPLSTYGRSFVLTPLATRLNGDYWRVIASEDNTNVLVNGVAQPTLSANQFFEILLTQPSWITSDKPLLVMQYSPSSSFDNVKGDPFMMINPPYEQYCSTYVVSTVTAGFGINYLNITAPNNAVSSVLLDGVAIPSVNFTQVGVSGFSVASIPVSPGAHTLSSSWNIGCQVYGFDKLEGYGYPGGTSAWLLAEVVGINSGPEESTGEINSEHCVQTRVFDGEGNPLAGIRVDFEQRGSNPGGGSSVSNDSGYAEWCYVGTNPGMDTIFCRYYEYVDTLFQVWDLPLPVELSSFTGRSDGKNAVLEWTTSNELNNSGFEIQRRTDVSDWVRLEFVDGHGNSAVPVNYAYTDRSLTSGSYQYRLKQIDFNGNYEYFNLSGEIIIGVPEKFELSQNYPNPFNPVTRVDFALPADGNIRLEVYDLSGKLIKSLANEFRSAGYYTINVDASGLSSGAYFYRLELRGTGGVMSKTMKMVVLK